MKLGYARVSTGEQDLTIQETALKAAGCERLFCEKASGTSRDKRVQLAALLSHIRAGDVLVITRIDRLARSMRDLQNIVHEVRQKGAALMATEQPIDTSTAAGKAFLDMLGVFAEFETNLRAERQREGIDQAKAAGKYKGRKKKPITIDRINALKAERKSMGTIARELGCARATLYRVLGEAA
jgi:DNA invertase Pin-like site-specific DNA recombinase